MDCNKKVGSSIYEYPVIKKKKALNIYVAIMGMLMQEMNAKRELFYNFALDV